MRHAQCANGPGTNEAASHPRQRRCREDRPLDDEDALKEWRKTATAGACPGRYEVHPGRLWSARLVVLAVDWGMLRQPLELWELHMSFLCAKDAASS